MNMMAPYGGTLLTELLIHAAYFLTAVAFLLRDILWLRLLAIVANLCVGAAALRAGMDPNSVVLLWASALVVINLGHSAWLLRERYLTGFTADEQQLYEAAFKELDPVSVRRLLRHGVWKSFDEKSCLARQGVPLDDLHLIATGQAAVLLGGRIAARLSLGKFIGEISFLSGEPASATIVATAPLTCLTWKKADLERTFKRRPELLEIFHAAVGRDLANKVAAHNVKLSMI